MSSDVSQSVEAMIFEGTQSLRADLAALRERLAAAEADLSEARAALLREGVIQGDLRLLLVAEEGRRMDAEARLSTAEREAECATKRAVEQAAAVVAMRGKLATAEGERDEARAAGQRWYEVATAAEARVAEARELIRGDAIQEPNTPADQAFNLGLRRRVELSADTVAEFHRAMRDRPVGSASPVVTAPPADGPDCSCTSHFGPSPGCARHPAPPAQEPATCGACGDNDRDCTPGRCRWPGQECADGCERIASHLGPCLPAPAAAPGTPMPLGQPEDCEDCEQDYSFECALCHAVFCGAHAEQHRAKDCPGAAPGTGEATPACAVCGDNPGADDCSGCGGKAGPSVAR